jgi:DNA-directed RNA polymerase specialized sigma24 family protein
VLWSTRPRRSLPSATSSPGDELAVNRVEAWFRLDQYDIAARVGCSQTHVSRLLRRALGRLRSQLLVG